MLNPSNFTLTHDLQRSDGLWKSDGKPMNESITIHLMVDVIRMENLSCHSENVTLHGFHMCLNHFVSILQRQK